MACEQHVKVKDPSTSNVPGLNKNLLDDSEYNSFIQDVLKERVPKQVFNLAKVLQDNGATGVDVVGGFNRDLTQEFIDAKSQGRSPTPSRIDNSDFDVEVGGMTMNGLVDILKTKFNPPFLRVVDSDAQFFVVKCYYTPNDYIDVSLRRKERYQSQLTCQSCQSKFDYSDVSYDDRIAKRCPSCKKNNSLFDTGSRDEFDMTADLDIPRKDAAERRDFTWNALMLSLPDGKMIDEWDGVRDLLNKSVRWITRDTFTQDPIRFARAAYFASKDSMMKISPELWECAIGFNDRKQYLNQAKLYEVYEKMFDKGKYFVEAMDYLTKSGWIKVQNRDSYMRNVHKIQQSLFQNNGKKFEIDIPRVSLSKDELKTEQKRRYAAFMFSLMMSEEPEDTFAQVGAINDSVEKASRHLMTALKTDKITKDNVYSYFPQTPYGFTIKDVIKGRTMIGKPPIEKDALALLEKNNWEKPEKIYDGNKIRTYLTSNGIKLDKTNMRILGEIDRAIYGKQLTGDLGTSEEAERIIDEKIEQIKKEASN